MYYQFLPLATECENNLYIHSKNFCLNLNTKYPVIQKNLNWGYNPYVPSTKNMFRELFVYVHCTKLYFSTTTTTTTKRKEEANEIQRIHNKYFLFDTSENIYIFMSFSK